MREKYKKIFIAGVILGAVIALVAIFVMKDGGSSEKKTAGPEDVIIGFTAAMKEGDFEKAYSLCDTSSMHAHLDAYVQLWEIKSAKDSAAFAATLKILSETAVEIDGVEEKDGVCFVGYTLEMDGDIRKCQASLKKEEGEWKIAEITSAN